MSAELPADAVAYYGTPPAPSDDGVICGHCLDLSGEPYRHASAAAVRRCWAFLGDLFAVADDAHAYGMS